MANYNEFEDRFAELRAQLATVTAQRGELLRIVRDLQVPVERLRITDGPHGVGYDEDRLAICRVLGTAKRLVDAIAAVERAQSSASRVMQRTGDDCMRACVATYLGVDYEQVPELSGANWSDVLRDWLAPRGLGFFSATVGHDAFQDVFCKATVIVAGKSPRGILHAVIYRDGKLWHDPHPEGGGIESVQDVDVIFPLRMAVERAQAQGGAQ